MLVDEGENWPESKSATSVLDDDDETPQPLRQQSQSQQHWNKVHCTEYNSFESIKQNDFDARAWANINELQSSLLKLQSKGRLQSIIDDDDDDELVSVSVSVSLLNDEVSVISEKKESTSKSGGSRASPNGLEVATTRPVAWQLRKATWNNQTSNN